MVGVVRVENLVRERQVDKLLGRAVRAGLQAYVAVARLTVALSEVVEAKVGRNADDGHCVGVIIKYSW